MSTIKTWQERLPQDHVPTQMDRNKARDAEIEELRAALAASGGNAAISEISPEKYVHHTLYDMDKKVAGYAYETEQVMLYARSYAVASAPNAALVALKEACDLIRLEVADGVHTEEYRRGMAVLSAAGQEVGK